ncbi:MAG: DUF1707 domain-containing protein [Longimicrobiales bacterium]|nr:DUF1707 domain-containing protein [Longimicrobiales bacterium]
MGDATRDGERQEVVDRLCTAFADDLLTLEEFEARVELAHRAGTRVELDTLLDDLPAPSPPARRGDRSKRDATALRAPDPVPERPPVPTRVPDRALVAGCLGGGKRSGGWVPARSTTAIGILGGVSLDLRESPFAAGVTEIECYALMGGVEIIAPPGVHIECSGLGLLGGFEYSQEEAPTDPDAPILRITGVAVMAGIEVTVRHPGESSRSAKRRRRALREAQLHARRLERGA